MKRAVLALTFASILAAAAPTASPQGTWVTKAPLPTLRSGFPSAALNGLLYTIGGQTPAPSSVVEAYNPATDSWASVAPLPVPIQRASAAVVNGLLYVVGGCADEACSSLLNTVYAYDPSTNAWTSRANIPTPRRDPNFLAVLNGVIYAAGGGQGPGCSATNSLEAYDPTVDTWTELAPMPVAHWTGAVAALGGKIYVAGGGQCSGQAFVQLTETDVYDPSTNTWSQAAPMPIAVDGPQSNVLNGKLYVLDGNAGGNCNSCTLVYDPSTNMWASNSSDPTARFGPQGDVINGSLYVVGGANLTNTTILSSNEVFIPPSSAATAPNLFVSSGASVFEYDGTTGAFIKVFNSSGIGDPVGLAFGSDGNLYASNVSPDQVSQYNVTTGVVKVFGGPLYIPSGLTIGPNGNLFVGTGFVVNNQGMCCVIVEFNGPGVVNVHGGPGTLLGTFVPQGSGGLAESSGQWGLVFGPNGNLFVISALNNSVLEYDGVTGAFITAFVPSGSGGLTSPTGLVFGPNGNLFVSSQGTNQVLEYNGATGAFVQIFVTNSGPYLGYEGLVFGPNGNLFVAGGASRSVLEYDGTTGAPVQVFVPAVVGPGCTASSCPGGGPHFLTFGPTATPNTPTGFNATVTPVDPTTGAHAVTIIFPQITQAGQTTVSGSSNGPAPPQGFEPGNPPVFYNLSTTAAFVGPLTVCISYNNAFTSPASLAIMHFENGIWVDRTVSNDTVQNVICASVSSLSPFAVFQRQPGTTTAVTSSQNPSVFGQAITFTATVTPASGSGTPTGTVNFNDGAATLGTGTLSGGQASFTTTSALSVGSHNITAVYGGDVNFAGSTSAALTQTVNKASTTMALASSASPSTLNQSVNFTASVSVAAPGSGTPTGTVTFNDGSTALATVTLSSAGMATFNTSALTVSSHSITAVYSGDTNFNGGNVNRTQQVAYGICVLYDQAKSVHGGATFPIKVALCDVNSADVSSSTVVLNAKAVTMASGFSGTPDSPGSANPDNDFRFGSTLGTTGGYIFNLSTGGLAPGTYSLQFAAGADPVLHAVMFGVAP